MAISAALVKELRERTGAGMMECKKALVETGGELEAAVEHLRKTGIAKAEKKAARTAAEGVIRIVHGDDARAAAMVEVNSETDFVAKEGGFQRFAEQVARRVLEADPADVSALLALPFEAGEAKDVETASKELVAKIGENIAVRRFVRYHTETGVLGSYVHGHRIGVLVELEGGDEALAKELAMHVSWSQPAAVDEAGVPAEMVEKEKGILRAQAEESGKPPEIVEKMIAGRLKKFYGEVTLVGQPFVKDPDQTVGQLLERRGARVVRFDRFEVGEGIEKAGGDFAEEVMAQVHDR
ncbi:MAG: elongation factor Ts [Gammaproteobacteria bacterium]|nr:elongation factor Ts [Gammaproteobacteria bacterium]